MRRRGSRNAQVPVRLGGSSKVKGSCVTQDLLSGTGSFKEIDPFLTGNLDMGIARVVSNK